MSNRAWMPLHIADYLADTGHLTVTEHGAYMLLIMAYWQRGGLPEDERMIARMARMTPDQWAESRDVLADLFEDGWRHKRIDAELAKADEIIEKRKNAASAMHKRRKSAAHAVHMQSTCSDTRVPPLTSNQDTTLLGARVREIYEAAGITDETKTPGLLVLSEPINWLSSGCDLDADVLPTLRALSARKQITNWRYCTNAVFEARDRRLAPPPPVQQRAASPPMRRTGRESPLDVANRIILDERAKAEIPGRIAERISADGG